MSVACPCGAPGAVRHGSKPSSHLAVVAGRVERMACQDQRYLCKACKRTFAVQTAHAAAQERAARELAAETVFALGRAGAERALDLKESVLGRLMAEWQAARDPDTLDVAPDFLLLETARLRDGEAVLVADVDRETLVEVADTEGLDAWFDRPDCLPPVRACVPLDPGIAGILRRRAPQAIVMVAPSAVLRAIRTAVGAGLRALRSDPAMRRRNAFPGTARFLRALDGRAAAGEGWPVEVTGLLGAGRAAGAVARAPSAEAGARLWREYEIAAATPGAGPLARLMATWRAAILAGLDHRFVDRLAGVLGRLRRLSAQRRPTMLLRDYRCLVLLRDFERGAPSWNTPSMPGASVALGRPLEGLAELLLSQTADAGGVPG